MKRMLSLLSLNPQPISLAVTRIDFMLDGHQQPKLVEANTISAAFLCGAPRVQRMHRQLMQRQDAPSQMVGKLPRVTDSDVRVVQAMADAHHRYSPGARDTGVLFVVLEKEHLLVESLLEQQLRETQNIQCATLTLPGCNERLAIDPSSRELLMDSVMRVSVVYFRGGISDQCYTEAGWAAREMIERSMAIKCPSVDWLLAGSKVMQVELAKEPTVERLLPRLDGSVKSQLLGCLTRGRVVEDPKSVLNTADMSGLILKKERGVWVGEQIHTELAGKQSTRQYLLMDKMEPQSVPAVTFVRNGVVDQVGPGVQELGTYGVFLEDEQAQLAECAGYLVRTKPEQEVDGGVCKGIAVLDSLRLIE